MEKPGIILANDHHREQAVVSLSKVFEVLQPVAFLDYSALKQENAKVQPKQKPGKDEKVKLAAIGQP